MCSKNCRPGGPDAMKVCWPPADSTSKGGLWTVETAEPFPWLSAPVIGLRHPFSRSDVGNGSTQENQR
jgi:hypothetical protein